MNSLYKTLIFFMSFSLLLFALFLGLDKSKRIYLPLSESEVPQRESREFRDFVASVKWHTFQELGENWCRKFNCQ